MIEDLWNMLPADLVVLGDLDSFKSRREQDQLSRAIESNICFHPILSHSYKHINTITFYPTLFLLRAAGVSMTVVTHLIPFIDNCMILQSCFYSVRQEYR